MSRIVNVAIIDYFFSVEDEVPEFFLDGFDIKIPLEVCSGSLVWDRIFFLLLFG